nr:hypothetical protein [uncultured Dialister sp.]
MEKTGTDKFSVPGQFQKVAGEILRDTGNLWFDCQSVPSADRYLLPISPAAARTKILRLRLRMTGGEDSP